MDLIFAICVMGFLVGYGIVLAIGIEKGKPWAYETTHALSMIDPQAGNMPRPAGLGIEPSAGREPSADREPSANENPSLEPPAVKLVA